MAIETSKKSTRCQQCNKKVGIMYHICKCEKLLCISHLAPQEHGCTYDFKKEAAATLTAYLNTEPRASSFERIE